MDTIHKAESWILSSSVPRSYGEHPHYIRSVRLVLVCMSHCVQTKRIVESLCWGGVCALAGDGWWRGGRLRWVPPCRPVLPPCTPALVYPCCHPCSAAPPESSAVKSGAAGGRRRARCGRPPRAALRGAPVSAAPPGRSGAAGLVDADAGGGASPPTSTPAQNCVWREAPLTCSAYFITFCKDYTVCTTMLSLLRSLE